MSMRRVCVMCTLAVLVMMPFLSAPPVGPEGASADPAEQNGSTGSGDEPWTTIFEDSFTSTSLSTSRWPTSGRTGTPTVVGSSGGVSNPPSSPYALDLDGTNDGVTSRAYDLSMYASGTFSFYYEKGGNGDGPEPGEDLVVEWELMSGWVEAMRANGSDANTTTFTQVVLPLPQGAFHTQFAVRFSVSAGQTNEDDWYIDDVLLDAVRGPPWVNLTVPNGGESWPAGTYRNIKWSAGGGTGTLSIDLEYTTTGTSGTWKTIATGLTNSGTYSWLVPNEPSTDCYVRVTVTDQSQSANDISDANFTIYVPLLTVWLKDPNGGESWEVGQVYFVNWSAAGGVPKRTIDLDYSTTGPSGPWKSIVTSTADTGGYAWTVPNDPSTDAYVRITVHDSAGKSATDVSNSSFTIRMPPLPTITVTSPDGGENWTAGDVKDITWTSSGKFNRMNISYSTSGPSGPWTLITDQALNIGVYSWTVPNTPTTDAYVKVHADDLYGRLAEDASNASFTISPPPFSVTLVVPNGGEKWLVGSQQVVSWTITGGSSPFTSDLEYSTTGNGGPWTQIATGVAGTSYTWTVPDAPTDQAYIRVTVTDSTSASSADMNDGEFLIVLPQPTAHVVQPNGGETLVIGSTYTARWTASGGTGALTTDLSYSTSGWGGPYISIATGLTGTSYAWTVPDTPTSDAFIKVSVSDQRSTVEDTSDTAFIIATSGSGGGEVSLIQPAGGESWNVYTEHEIIWTTSGNASYSISLEFSVKGPGGPWTSIASPLQDTGRYRWRIPDIGSTSRSCFVRVEARDTSTGATYTDMNRDPFTIVRGSVIVGIRGTVRDAVNMTPIPYVDVRLVGTEHSSLTDESGEYVIPDVPAGTYTLEASVTGYETTSLEVTVVENEMITLDIQMTPLEETVPGNPYVMFIADNWQMLLLVLVILVALVGVAVAAAKRRASSPGTCRVCRVPVPPRQKLCARCAESQGLVICPKCKKMLPRGMSWCSACGEIIPGTAAPSDTEASSSLKATVITVTSPAACASCDTPLEMNSKGVRCPCGKLYHKACSDAVEICLECKRRVRLA